MDFAEQLRSAVGRRGWTTRELGRRVGVHHSTAGRWLNGTTMPTPDAVETLERVLNMSLERTRTDRRTLTSRVEALEAIVDDLQRRLS